MSTNKTQNYQLHKWEAEDDFLRTEFNENFAKIDGALFGRVRVLFGTYNGNSTDSYSGSQRVELGVKPYLVFILNNGTVTSNGNHYTYGGMAGEGFPAYEAIVLDDSGFTVKNQNDNLRLNYKTNYVTNTYHYFALY